MKKSTTPMLHGARSRVGPLLGATAIIALVALSSPALAQKSQGTDIPTNLTDQATVQPEEETGVLVAKAPDARRVYVADQDNFNVINRIYAIDGGEGKLIGMLDAGKLAGVNLAPDGSSIYVSSTLYSRVSRGERNDLIEVWDPRTLATTAEIDIPEERFLVQPMDSMTQVTPDGRHLLYYRFSPAPGVGIVDLQQNKHVATVDIPDCYYVLPTGKNRFYMHCRQGSLLQVTFTDDGKAETKEGKPFHPEDKHLFDQPAFSPQNGKAFFISYEGTVYPVDLSGDEPSFGKSWEMFSQEERGQKWRPGGWQVSAYHRPSNQLFVLVRQGGDSTHHNPSKEVWVYNAADGKRVKRITLNGPANSISVSQDQEPLLFALDAHHASLGIYDVASGKHRNTIDQLGHAPHMLITAYGQ